MLLEPCLPMLAVLLKPLSYQNRLPEANIPTKLDREVDFANPGSRKVLQEFAKKNSRILLTLRLVLNVGITDLN